MVRMPVVLLFMFNSVCPCSQGTYNNNCNNDFCYHIGHAPFLQNLDLKETIFFPILVMNISDYRIRRRDRIWVNTDFGYDIIV